MGFVKGFPSFLCKKLDTDWDGDWRVKVGG